MHRGLDSVVVLGGGAVGTLLAESLRGRSTFLTVIDRDEQSREVTEGVRWLVADVTSPDDLAVWVDALRLASVIVLSLPEDAVLSVLPTLASHARVDALLVETCSVKAGVAEALAAIWTGRPALGINPLFRPSLGAGGRRIAVVSHRPGGVTEAFEQALEATGAVLVRVGAAEHDRLAAVTQTLPHACLLAFGAAVAEGCSRESVADLMAMTPPPFLALLSLSVRVGAGDVAVYREIQGAERAGWIRDLLQQAMAALDDAVGSEDDFGRLQARILEKLGPDLVAELLNTSEEMLAELG